MTEASSGLTGVPAPPGMRLTVAAVARRLGVAPATLRTWDRRYGLGPSEHTAGAHRRYTPADVARLELMQRMLTRGAAPAEAARIALETPIDIGAPIAEPDAAAVAESATGHPGGGQVVAIPGGTPTARGLARAAMALDSETCARVVEDSIARRGVTATWNQLLVPVLVGVGQRWEATGGSVEVEHLLSETIIAAMLARVTRLTAPVNHRSVLLSCAPEEQHTLPLFALAAALAERRVACRVLGARVPVEALEVAVRRTGPGAVFVWAQREGRCEASELGPLSHGRTPPLLLLGGPGWGGDVEASGGVAVDSLDEAVERIATAVCD